MTFRSLTDCFLQIVQELAKVHLILALEYVLMRVLIHNLANYCSLVLGGVVGLKQMCSNLV